jgi:hypothetical protein
MKVLLMIALLGGLRTGILIAQMSTSQVSMLYRALDWIMSLTWPTKPAQHHA